MCYENVAFKVERNLKTNFSFSSQFILEEKSKNVIGRGRKDSTQKFSFLLFLQMMFTLDKRDRDREN